MREFYTTIIASTQHFKYSWLSRL